LFLRLGLGHCALGQLFALGRKALELLAAEFLAAFAIFQRGLILLLLSSPAVYLIEMFLRFASQCPLGLPRLRLVDGSTLRAQAAKLVNLRAVSGNLCIKIGKLAATRFTRI
jgi:hypothetical protein